MTRSWIMFAAILICTGCAGTAKMHEEPKGKQMLGSGIKSYEDGNYKEAVGELQGALDAGLSSSADKVAAHKFLAFTYCISSREALCREEFMKALAIDPKFELAPAEAGHPIWGNVFRSIRKTPK
ncbi:MAG: TssQ family T6SS-associated lipoprotein [Burkholderiales bacterium]|nr:TssQ family T6SS-associated lipoprotein [Burkholderiales bacterium]